MDDYFKIEGIERNTYNKSWENKMDKLGRKEIREMIVESMMSSKSDKKRKSEMRQFSESKSGQVVQREGRKISSCSETIKKVAEDQTGTMRETLNRIAEFVEKTGGALSGMGSMNEGSSMTEGLPTLAELKQLRKDIEKLEK